MVIAINGAVEMQNYTGQINAGKDLTNSAVANFMLKNELLVLGINMLIILALIFGGMKVALEMGIAGASYFTNAASRTGMWARKKTWAATKGGTELATRQARAAASEKAGFLLAKTGIRPLTILGTKAMAYGQKTRERGLEDRSKEIETAMKSKSSEERKAYEKAILAAGGTGAAAMILDKAIKKQFNDPVKFWKESYPTAVKYGISNAVNSSTGLNKDLMAKFENLQERKDNAGEVPKLSRELTDIQRNMAREIDREDNPEKHKDIEMKYEPMIRQKEAEIKAERERYGLIKQEQELTKEFEQGLMRQGPEALGKINFKAWTNAEGSLAEKMMGMVHKLNSYAVVDAYKSMDKASADKFHDKWMNALNQSLPQDKQTEEGRRELIIKESPMLAKQMESMGRSFAFSAEKIKKAIENESTSIKIVGKYANVKEESKDRGPKT